MPVTGSVRRSARAHGSKPCLGRWHPPSPQGVPCRRAADLARCGAAVPVSGTSRIFIDAGRRHAGQCQVANRELANRNEGPAQSPLCRYPCAQADGSPQRIRDKGQQHPPGDEAWLIGEHRTSGEKKYHLANLSAATDLRTCRHHQGAMDLRTGPSATQRGARPRSLRGTVPWQGLHRHALMTMIAYAFLQHRRLTKARRGKNQWATASTKLARRPTRHPRPHSPTAASAMPVLQTIHRQKTIVA